MSAEQTGSVQIGEWRVDPALDTISRGPETHKIEPRMIRLLMCLANSDGAVVSVERLLDEVWSGVVVGSASVYQAVSQLRKLLGDVDTVPTYIANVPRKGYRLIAPVKRIDARPLIAPLAPVAEPVPVVVSVVAPRHYRPRLIGVVVLTAMVLIGSLAWRQWHRPAPSAATEASIVVLPFIDMTAEKTDQSFCDGLTEELSNWLAQIPTLRVVARTSAFAFRGQNEDVRKIGKALDTNHILEGSMRRSGDRMRITVQLIDAASGYHLWSESYDRPVNDAISVQEDISRAVAGTLQIRLTADSDRQFAARRTANPQAYQLYLAARQEAQRLSAAATEREIELYQQVLALDPQFAPAYAQLAWAWINQGYYHNLPIAEVAARVEPAIATALRLDGRLAAAYAARGELRAVQSRTVAALADLQLAISMNPSEMSAFAAIGKIQLFDARPREALATYDRAAALDPLNYAVQDQRCTVLGDLARYQQAVQACERAHALQSGLAPPADYLAWLAESRGRIDEALRWNEASLQAEPADDFNLYWTRASFYLSIGLATPARRAVERGRRITSDNTYADAALVRVVYREGGADALRRYVDTTRLDRSTDSVTLFEAAYAHLLLGDAAMVKKLMAAALAAPNRPPGFADDPWSARGASPVGNSYRVDLAAAEFQLGDPSSARVELGRVLTLLNNMIAAGIERNATYALRAKVLAMQGQGDAAIRDLSKAASLGWRQAWWATHEPYFASLQSRSDFQELIAHVSRSNERLATMIKADD